jgi:2-succinyl-5-enolpyruvyl-6-hydroxy-3-cyclohexene-1-carboxylate synthase
MINHLRWTSELLGSFYSLGVRNIIISPGSRSTPLVQAASLHEGFKKSVVLDERSAAYIALGMGKRTGLPSLLICTSGTAVANYMPAVVEAKKSGVPMIILSADRPPNLRGIGSSQTVDQIKLFGNQAVFFHEAGEPVHTDQDYKRLNYAARQSFEASINPGGAAHINLPFRKPLEATEQQIEEEKELLSKNKFHSIKITSPSKAVHTLDESIRELITSGKKPVIIAGPSDPLQSLSRQIRSFTNQLEIPVVAEPGSGLTASENNVAINGYEQFLRDPEKIRKLEPDLILRFGDQSYTKSILSALDAWQNIPTVHFATRSAWQDQSMSVTQRVICRPEDQIELGFLKNKINSSWKQIWLNESEQAKRKREEIITGQNSLTDCHLFHFLYPKLRENWNMMLSNSFPVRDMAMFGGVSSHQFVNRGAAGIDGITSTAWGIHQSSGLPTACITGDLAFLHDSNALLSIKQTDRPFLIIVINNGGGNIFRMLPVYQQKDIYETYFETPQHVRIAELARAHSINYTEINTVDQLIETEPDQLQGATIIECKTDAGQSMEIRKKLWES